MAYYPPKARTWHLRDASADISGYKRLVMLPQTVETEATLTGASSGSSEVLIGAFVSDVVGVTSLDAGVWRFNLKADVDSATDVTQIKIYVYSRDSVGAETALFNVTSAEINNTTVAAVTVNSASQSAFTTSVSDRVVVKFYALSNSGSAKTVTLYYQGATNYSTVLLPGEIPVREGDMTKAVYDANGDGAIDSVGSGNISTDTIWDAKGDLAVGTGADTADRLTVGADGTFLTADSGETTGLKWSTISGSVAASWDIKTAIPTAVADEPAIPYNGLIYVIGGYLTGGANNPTNLVQIYNPITDSWFAGTNMTTSRWGLAAAEYNGVIYCFAGATNLAEAGSAKCEAYDTATDSWSSKTDVPSDLAHQGLMAVTVGTKIYLFYRTYVYEFDPAGNGGDGSYTSKATAPIDRTWGTCATVTVSGEERIYIIGGYSWTTTQGTDANYYYVPSSNSWSSAQTVAPYASWGQTRDNPVINDQIYYAFGQQPADTYFAELRRYTPATDSWETLADATYQRDGLGCAVVGAKLYCLGGRTGTTAYAYNEVYTPADAGVQYALLDAVSFPDQHANDVDALTGIHHTLGTGATQAAAGNHIHDDRYYTEAEVAALIAGLQYRQFVYEVSGGDFTFIIDGDGNPVTALEDLE